MFEAVCTQTNHDATRGSRDQVNFVNIWEVLPERNIVVNILTIGLDENSFLKRQGYEFYYFVNPRVIFVRGIDKLNKK